MLQALLFTLALNAFAQTSPGGKPVITLWTNGSRQGLREAAPKDKYQVLDPKDEEAEMKADGYLKPVERNALFRKLNLDGKLHELDELDKDMLVMGAPHYTVAEVKRQYPMLDERDITRLKTELRKRK